MTKEVDAMEQTEHLEVSWPLNEDSITVVNRFAVGDVLEIKLDGEWVRFWDFPIRDAVEAAEAKSIVHGRGFYSQAPNPKREYRTVG